MFLHLFHLNILIFSFFFKPICLLKIYTHIFILNASFELPVVTKVSEWKSPVNLISKNWISKKPKTMKSVFTNMQVGPTDKNRGRAELKAGLTVMKQFSLPGPAPGSGWDLLYALFFCFNCWKWILLFFFVTPVLDVSFFSMKLFFNFCPDNFFGFQQK